jgi:uncharacterized YccA/Bax inhibitor family protein
VAIVTVFNKKWSPFTTPVYAILEGLFLGGISAIVQQRFQEQYPNIVLHAVLLTFGVLVALLMAYRSGLINPTQNFRLGVFAATGGIVMMYFFSFILGMFGMEVGFLHGNGPVAIIVSVIIVIIAALNLVLDFDFIEQGAEAGAPKYMEWYAAFGLVVTLVWLYIEILRLLSKLAANRR